MAQTETPFWQVQAVFDPDGGGKDFAYTIGLFEAGLPELHLWSRPTEGDDPGLDWKLSMRDSCVLLNEFARRLIDGSLGVGSTIRRDLDDGRAVLDFRVEAPGDRDVLEAFGIAPGSLVLPIPWSLRREPEGPLAALTPEAERTGRETYAEIADRLDPQARPPSGWELPGRPTWEPDQRFGPLTPVVLARAEQFRQADDDDLNNLLHSASLVDCGYGSLTSPVALGVAAARPVGRSRAVEALMRAIDDLVDEVTVKQQRRWHRIIDRGLGSDREPAHKRDRIRHNAGGLLRDLVMSCLVTEAVADVQDPGTVLAGRGPWLRGIAPMGELPGPAWSAHPEILAKVTGLIGHLPAEQLGAIALLHREAASDRLLDGESYQDVALKLEAWAVVAAAGCPWDPMLSTLPAWQPWIGGLGSEWVRVVMAPIPPLQEWATCLTSALTFRARLTSDEVRAFVEPFRELLPGLEDLLNSV
jgi:hypothetical protein